MEFLFSLYRLKQHLNRLIKEYFQQLISLNFTIFLKLCCKCFKILESETVFNPVYLPLNSDSKDLILRYDKSTSSYIACDFKRSESPKVEFFGKNLNSCERSIEESLKLVNG